MVKGVDRKPMSVGSLCHVGGEGLTHAFDANTFVIRGEHPVIIECGSKVGYTLLRKRLGNMGIRMDQIAAVFATHGDWDHVSGMELLSKESDAELFVPAKDRAAVEDGDSVLTEAVFYGETANPIKVAGEIDDSFKLAIGKVVISAIETPGHTPGSVCYTVEEDGITTLVAADALYGFHFLNRSQNTHDDLRVWKESLQRLRGYNFDCMAIGHAMKGFRGDVAVRLEEAQRQFATLDIEKAVEEAKEQDRIYINPWHKMAGQYFKY